eukprot:scaffold8492_cov67-Skeletonema_dohrnii-CCMP3373.AAC.1
MTDGLQTSNQADSRFSNQSMTINYGRIHHRNVPTAAKASHNDDDESYRKRFRPVPSVNICESSLAVMIQYNTSATNVPMMAAFALVLGGNAISKDHLKKCDDREKVGRKTYEGGGKGEGRENPFQPKTNNQETKTRPASSRVKIDRTNKLLLASFMMMATDGWCIYYGREGEVIPPGVTRVRIHESLTVIPARAFYRNPNIRVVECHVDVKTVEAWTFRWCPSLRRVIMPGVEVVEERAFAECHALAIVECGKLKIIGNSAFDGCKSLTSINLPSTKIVEGWAFWGCEALTNVKFGKELESIGRVAFYRCTSLERITIPLKDGRIAADDTFQMCEKLKQVDLVEGEILRDTIAALLLEEWRNDMKNKIDAIHQILPTTPAG